MAVNSILKIFEFWRFGVHELAVCTRWPKLLTIQNRFLSIRSESKTTLPGESSNLTAL
jgi:hypothetical protein